MPEQTVDNYWSYCVAQDTKCPRQRECIAASKCLFDLTKPFMVNTQGPPCQAYDYCPKRHNCMTASRCLDARAGPPRRVGMLAQPTMPTHRVILQDDNAKIRVSFHEIELDALRAIRLGMDLIQAGLRHLERAKRTD